ncbi:hypothetical protein XA68_11289 [Ophiocordyceps unilateralis]|uniref:NACHT domain-containing protein n=1 Tax=Ophiocordyceps unilateralis TaxID=268505 RepID=A0A2A9PG78_OPHUN|nr:hypothetical protein XA68_11289 [Ophiocordyceps unilateralis]
MASQSRAVRLTPVHPLAGNDDADTDVDVIAIHGLDARSPDTWTWKSVNGSEPFNWLEMLPQQLGPVRIFTCDWPGDLFQQKDMMVKTIVEFARLLLVALHSLRPPQTRKPVVKDRPILFIASCLGGIILAKALIIADEPGCEYSSVRRSARAVVFLATPFRGTSFQDVATWAERGLKTWASIRRQQVNTELLGSAKTPTLDRGELVRRFTSLCLDQHHPCQVITVYELGKTNLYRKIGLGRLFPAWFVDKVEPPKPLVDHDSANLDIVLNPLPIDQPHGKVNKFCGPEDPNLCNVVRAIERLLQTIRAKPLLDEVDAQLRNYYLEPGGGRLKIQRLSGDMLPLDQCYINLAIVQCASKSAIGVERKRKTSPFSPLARRSVDSPDQKTQVELASIFNLRQGPDSHMVRPRRILIRGRAGVGKTTLCKKLVHEFISRKVFADLFDRILWLPLRKLKGRSAGGLDPKQLFHEEYFSTSLRGDELAQELRCTIESSSPGRNRTLFVLDGLDEISQELDPDSSLFRLLTLLLDQPNVVITSRPHANLPTGLRDVHLELEVIGFYPHQVDAYLEADPKIKPKAEDVRTFLRDHWVIQGLVQVPVLLDALCYTWEDFDSDFRPESMTGIYRAIESKLWQKDIYRLGQQSQVQCRTMNNASIRHAVDRELRVLEALAFTGIWNEVVEFDRKHRWKIYDHFDLPATESTIESLSFLRTSDPSLEDRHRTYHFIHLTFQEYFAARYFIRQVMAKQPLECLRLELPKTKNANDPSMSPQRFLWEHKYTARYDILWRFVAGLLDKEGQAFWLFDEIEKEPCDLLGPTHQRLVMRCLSEVSTEVPTRPDLEQRLFQWLCFETEYCKDQASSFAYEMEFPEKVLETALKEGADDFKKEIMMKLAQRATISPGMMDQVAPFLKHGEASLRAAAVEALGRQCALPDEILRAVIALLTDDNSTVRYTTMWTLGRRPAVPLEVLNALVERPGDGFWDDPVLPENSTLPDNSTSAEERRQENNLRLRAFSILGRSALPPDLVTTIATRLQDQDYNVRCNAIKALASSVLPDETIDTIAAQLLDVDKRVREGAIKALQDYRSPYPNQIFEALKGRVEDEDDNIRVTAVHALGVYQSELSNDVFKSIAARLEDNSDKMKVAAGSILSRFSLPDEIVQTIAALLKHKNLKTQINALEALKGSSLPKEIIENIAARFEDKRSLVRQRAIETLGRSSLPEAVNEAIAVRLEDNDEIVQMAAFQVLGQIPRMESNVLDRITAWLHKKNVQTVYQILPYLSLGPTIPREILQVVAKQIKMSEDSTRDGKSFTRLQASVSEEFIEAFMSCLTPPARLEWQNRLLDHGHESLLSGEQLRFFYKVLLKNSFHEQLSWYIEDGESCVNSPDRIRRIPLHNRRDDFLALINKSRPRNHPLRTNNVVELSSQSHHVPASWRTEAEVLPLLSVWT